MATHRFKPTTNPAAWDNAANWDDNNVPASGDTVIIENSDVDITTGLDQSGLAGALALIMIHDTYRGKIGLAGVNGAASTYLKIRCTKCVIGRPTGSGTIAGGSQMLLLDFNTDNCTVVVNMTSSNGLPYKAPINIISSNSAALTIHFQAGRLSVGGDHDAEAAIVTAIYQGTRASQGDFGSDLRVGRGVTLTTLVKNSGRALIECAATTMTNNGGTLRTEGSGAVTTWHASGGYNIPNSTGTVTTANIKGGVGFDLLQSMEARTLTTMNIDYPDTGFKDNTQVTGTRTKAIETGGGLGSSGP